MTTGLRRWPDGMTPLVVAHGLGVVGSQITALALPTLAILHLNASALVASVLFAIEFGAQALASPVLGVLVDRARTPRRLLVGASLGYAAVVAAVPAAMLFDALTITLLAAVAAVTGALGSLITIGLQAAVPRLVVPEKLLEANSALAGARSVGQVAGPAVAGWLVQISGAVAMGADALTRLAGAIAYSRTRVAALAGAATATGPKPTFRGQLAEGVRVMRGRPVLVRVAVTAAAINFGGSGLAALHLLFAYEHLHLSPALVGITYVVSSVVSMLAVALAGRVIRVLGIARVVPVFAPLAGAALFLIPAAALGPPFITLVLYEAVFAFTATVWFIATTTLQQSLVPVEQLGRVIALGRAATTFAIPVGALLGGLLAGPMGFVPTLLLFAAVALLGGFVSSLRGIGAGAGAGAAGVAPANGAESGGEVGSIAPSSTADVDAARR